MEVDARSDKAAQGQSKNKTTQVLPCWSGNWEPGVVPRDGTTVGNTMNTQSENYQAHRDRC